MVGAIVLGLLQPVSVVLACTGTDQRSAAIVKVALLQPEDPTASLSPSVAQNGGCESKARPPLRLRTGRRRALLGLGAATLVYLAAVCCFSLLTPAWENNDEFQHVQYIEHLALTGHIPAITKSNGWESGQPPLYYAAETVWQSILRIPPFVPRMLPPAPPTSDPVHLELLHSYTAAERQQAIWIHELRIFSMLCGLVTVWGSFCVAWLALRSVPIATGAALFVAVLPKQAEVFGAITNDALVTALCTLILLAVVAWVQLTNAQANRRLVTSLALGFLIGLAALTKYTALPLEGLVFIAMAGIAWRRRLGGRDCLITLTTAFGTGGWWYVRNLALYGQLLATRANEKMLQIFFPGDLIITHLSISQLPEWLDATVRGVAQSFWYVGLWNQLRLAPHLSYALGGAACVALAAGFWSMIRPTTLSHANYNRYVGLLLAAAASGGVLAALLVASTTIQQQGRFLYVGVAGVATLIEVGTTSILARAGGIGRSPGPWVWPLALVALLAWVIVVDVVPLAGL